MSRSIHIRSRLSLSTPPITAGKTKRVYRDVDDPTKVFMYSTDHVSAGNGQRQSDVVGKGVASTLTSINVFTLLKNHSIPTAFLGQVDPTKPVFHSKLCAMRPYEVVARRIAVKGSSYLKRHPEVGEDHVFPEPVVEFYLKTTGRKWKGKTKTYELPCDDPLMIVRGDSVHLYLPDVKFDEENPILIVPKSEIYDSESTIEEAEMVWMVEQTKDIFLIVEAAWRDAQGGGRLADFKLEYGKTETGEMVLADVVDADSWRVQTFSGERLSKQPWREGCTDAEFRVILDKVVSITDGFRIYRYKPAV